jgi:hypothetical protein
MVIYGRFQKASAVPKCLQASGVPQPAAASSTCKRRAAGAKVTLGEDRDFDH